MTNWISVKDRLPNDEEGVLVVVSGKPHENIQLQDAYEIGSWCGDTKEWFIGAWPEWESPTVTYWMSLPDAPKECMKRREDILK